MKRFLSISKKVLKWLAILAISLLALLIIFVECFDRYLATEKGITWMFSEVPTEEFQIHYTPSGVRYLSLGSSEKPALLMVHGAPGSVLDWLNFSSNERIFDHFSFYQFLYIQYIDHASIPYQVFQIYR